WSEKQVGGFEVYVENLDDLEMINEFIYLEELPPNLYSESIRSKHPAIFDWLNLQNINEVVILCLMVLVAIINMITALLILILERRKMIGTLKAMGANDWSIRKIFLMHGAYITFLGLFFGNLFGIGLCLIQKYFQPIQLNEANYYLNVAPIHFDFITIIILNIVAILLTTASLIIPSILITKIDPVKALRFD
ncbi:MAG: FtsX-like permease family protein, partial [Bacteroidota bacterium]